MLIGALITGFGFVAAGIARGFSSWGALEYSTDTKVRALVTKVGVALPTEAHDIHYAISGFVDSSLWIRFTVPKDKIWDVVTSSIGKTEADFERALPKHLLREVHQNPKQTDDFGWWAPSSVSSPMSWSNPREKDGQHFFEDWLIDMDTGTFFITRWDT